MTILVATSSKHGSTRDIGSTIASALRMAGFEVAHPDIAQVGDLDRYQAAVIGSAIYMGRPTRQAARFVQSHQAELKRMPIWLFASGPLEPDDPLRDEQHASVADLAERIGAKGFGSLPAGSTHYNRQNG